MTEQRYTAEQIREMSSFMLATDNCLPSVNDCTHAAAMLLQAAEDMTAREGWVLVPIAPTQEQEDAGITELCSDNDDVTLIYAAMIAAAPRYQT